MKKIYFLTVLIGLGMSGFSQSYKAMKNDMSINFYDVCNAAEEHFKNIDINKKGSGWKGYQRWREANEYKYYPSGNRENVDPYFVQHAYESFLAKSPRNLKQGSDGWQELGPYSVDNISRHYAAGLGRIEDCFVSRSNPNTIYLGSRSGGFWKTTNGGATWQGGSTDFLFASGVNTIAVVPTNDNEILINVRNASNGYSHGIYRSTDGGNSWNESAFNPTNLGKGGLGSSFTIYRIAYHPTIADLVFVATNDGLYRSDDNLATWTLIYSPNRANQIEFHPTDPNFMYINDTQTSGKDFVFWSDDAGLTFNASAEITANAGKTGRLSVSTDCADCVYFGSDNGVFISTDKALNFTLISNPGAGMGAFTVNDLDTTNFVAGYIDAVASTDGGRNFNQVSWWSLGSTEHGAGDFNTRFQNSVNYVHADLRVGKSVNGVLYLGTDGFLCKSADKGATWEVISQGTAVRENYRLGTSQSNHYLTLLGSQDNGTSLRRKNDWLEVYGADGMEMLIHPLNPDWMIQSIQNGGRQASFNGGKTLTKSQPAGESGSGNADWLAPMFYDPNDHFSIYHFSRGIFRSDDFMDTWTQVGTPQNISSYIFDAAVAQNNSDIMVITQGSSIEKSTDGGATFTDTKNNLPNSSIRDVVFDPLDDNTMIVVYATYQNNGEKVFVTKDGGASWVNITNNLGDMPIHTVVIDHTAASNIYVGAEIGVYTMPMNGSTWELFNTDLPNTNVRELEINWGSNTLKAATWGRGLWDYPLKDRTDYPKIWTTEITNLPTYDSPKEGVDQFVTSTINYTGTLSRVFVKYSFDNPVFDNTLEMENLSDSTWKSVSALPNGTLGQKMFFKVFAVGQAGDTTETYKFMYRTQEFRYCDAEGTTGTGSDYIVNVSLNGMTNATGQDYYSLYTDEVIELYVDSTYTLEMTMLATFASDSAGAWIDYNKNATFDDWEILPMSQYVSKKSTAIFTVPNTDVKLDDTLRLRVRSSYYGDPESCGNDAGEVEDYLIIIRGCATQQTTENQQACGSYTWSANATTYTQSGTYEDTLVSVLGCDSIVILELDITDKIERKDTIVACDGYTWSANGQEYVTSGNYQYLDNSGSCDTLHSLALTINRKDTAARTVVACNDFTWDVNGTVYTTSGTYSVVLQNQNGCDSALTINLTIKTLNVTVQQTGNVLHANLNGATYQWINCQTGAEADNGKQQDFTPSQSGNYAVIIQNGSCTDTSECIQVIVDGVAEFGDTDWASVFPNPSTGNFTIDLGKVFNRVEVVLLTNEGKVVKQYAFRGQQTLLLETELAKGVYQMQIEADGNKQVISVEIE